MVCSLIFLSLIHNCNTRICNVFNGFLMSLYYQFGVTFMSLELYNYVFPWLAPITGKKLVPHLSASR